MTLTEKVYEYTSDDFLWENKNKEEKKSKFEERLCKKWDNAMENGVFWYTLEDVKRKNVPGRYNMTAQLNKKRFAQRRKPEEAKQVMMPFDSDKFHFNKIKEAEIIYELKRTDIDEERKDELIINISPIEYGHVLLVPNVDRCSPQVLDQHGIEAAVELCLISNKGLRIGFNSLCALASVNHQHFHVFFYHQQLPIDVADTKSLKRNVYCLDNYMVHGLVLQLTDRDIKSFALDVLKITSYLCDKNIAHNLAICKRTSIHTNDDSKEHVTVFIFPKKASPELTNDAFNTASLENAGFLPIRDEKEYENITEGDAVKILNTYSYQDEEFHVLCDSLCKITA